MVAASPSPGPSPDARAEEIFARARLAFAARAFPPTIKYSVRISGLRNGEWTGRTYDAFEDWPDQSVFTRSISEEETADPVKPPPFCFFGVGAPKRAGLELPGILGFPKLAVTYSFGLAARAAAAPVPEASDTGGLRTLYTAHALSRIYEVRLEGETAIDDQNYFHLTLRPLGNPGAYRVREMWVGETSYETRRLVTAGNFTGKETGAGNWTVDYAPSGSVWFLASETSQDPVADGTGRYDRVSVQFLNVTADPHENLDFGLSGSPIDVELSEPPEANGRT